MSDQIKLLQGNEACVEGALAAGMEFYAGYPITPSTEIAEISAQKLPAIGGHFIQMEDEIAGMAATLGASLAGKKSMTATSGPGFSLKQENLGYGCIAEIPCVIVNVQRGGPSTGLPTSPSQGDIMQAKWGTHGDHPIIALYPNSVQEIFDITIECFNMAEKYRTPVILLLDEIIAHMREKVDLSSKDSIKIIDRKRPTGPKEGYLPYKADEDLIPNMADFGTGYRQHVTGLTHDVTGFPSNSPIVALDMMTRLMKKIEINKKDIVKYEEYRLADADFAIVAFGATSRAAKDTVNRLREDGIKAGLFRPITIWPIAEDELISLSKKVNKIIVAEMNMGQYVNEVERVACKNCSVEFYGRFDGQPINPDEIYDFAMEVLR
ncbi:MAG: 2-oxoglutarate oxidoreductase, alpha subunit [Clostridiales bacterium 38_11]|nr:MAG: 2-oxoglutarate oxidoreductase, alpha subunit [Clostridiales bacterium 38_11]HBH11830.1 2-oxoacid:acceptor oxidoreductase subunit alpha [Clostridiales bacterium]